MEFKAARLDRTAAVTTVLVTALLVGLSIFFIFAIPYGWIWAIVMLSIILFSYLLSPTKYVFEGSRLVIRKVAGKRITIPLQTVQAYVTIPDFTKLRVSRTMGNGGLFGYYGMFSTAEYGTINCQLKKLKEVILIQTDHGTYAISPADRQQFEEYLVNTVQGLRSTIGKMAPVALSSIKYANPLVLIIPVIICVLTVIMVLALYTQLPDQIATHFNIHGNPDRWSLKTSFITVGLLPAIVLCAINIAIFLFVRKTMQRPALSYMMLVLFALFQVFVAYVSFDVYWFNEKGAHLIALPYDIMIYVAVISILLFAYIRKARATV